MALNQVKDLINWPEIQFATKTTYAEWEYLLTSAPKNFALFKESKNIEES